MNHQATKTGSAPVLFLIFERPDSTARVFEQIRCAKPNRLFIAADGPRRDRPGAQQRCQEARKIIDDGVDWPCEVRKLYRDENLGCRRAVSGAIDWFFEHVDEGIILEDDTLPHSDFFPYCSKLLERYREDPKVMHIGGFNPATGKMKISSGCWFSHHPWIWGWATWRRAWSLYDRDMATWNERHATLSSTFASGWEEAVWVAAWRDCLEDPERADTWDFPWMYTVRSLGGLSILPSGNLVQNLGYDDFATHTTDRHSLLSKISATAGTSLNDLPSSHSKFRDELFSRICFTQTTGFRTNTLSRMRILKHMIKSTIAKYRPLMKR